MSTINSPTRKAIVLGYHRITEVWTDPWSLCVSPACFAEQLERICARARPQLLEDLIASGPLSDPAIAVTFDDGYGDTLWAAKPLLERFSVPATVFLPTGHIGNAREFWWDALERLLLTPGTVLPTLSASVNGRRHEWTFPGGVYEEQAADKHRQWRAWEPGPTERHAAYRELWSLLGPLAEDRRRAVLDELFAAADLEPGARETHRLLREAELRELIDGELIRLGSHTVTHSILAAQARSEQEWEIATSKASLETLSGRSVTTFAYPFGQKEHYTRETAELVKAAGFIGACANFKGLMVSGTDRFEIPRLQMHEYDGPAFDRVIDQWLSN
jgi:peptidoglycan/xylan/chitin deacetylase (PgdA/CDA1 family)